jgi:hypothetical protein
VALELFEQVTPRSVRGEENPEHVLAGNSMAEVLHQGDYKKPRKESQSKDNMLQLVSMRSLSPHNKDQLAIKLHQNTKIKKAHISTQDLWVKDPKPSRSLSSSEIK